MSDMNQPWAFRHPIVLQDHLIPEKWVSEA